METITTPFLPSLFSVTFKERLNVINSIHQSLVLLKEHQFCKIQKTFSVPFSEGDWHILKEHDLTCSICLQFLRRVKYFPFHKPS